MQERFQSSTSRRTFATSVAAASAFYTVPGLFAEQLALTRTVTEARTIRTRCRWTPTTTC